MADEARLTLEGAILIVELLRRIPRRGFTTSRHVQAAQTTGTTALNESSTFGTQVDVARGKDSGDCWPKVWCGR